MQCAYITVRTILAPYILYLDAIHFKVEPSQVVTGKGRIYELWGSHKMKQTLKTVAPSPSVLYECDVQYTLMEDVVPQAESVPELHIASLPSGISPVRK